MTVGPLRIAGVNWADIATITASSSVSTLTPDRLQDEDIQNIWRADSSSASLVFALSATVEIGAIALINSNAGVSDAARYRVSTTDPTGADGNVYDSGTIPAGGDIRYGKVAHYIEPNVTGRYVRIDLTQSSPPEAGRGVVARTWGPSRHFSFGWEPLYHDHTRRTFSLGMNLHKDLLPRQEGLRFTLNGLVTAEFEDEIRELNRLNGTSREVLVCRDIEAANLAAVTYWGEMEATIRTSQRERDFFTSEFEVWNRL